MSGNNHINIETLIAGNDTISTTLAKQYAEYVSERRQPSEWKNAKIVVIFNTENKKDIKNCRPTYL